jgi:hypothetical protein
VGHTTRMVSISDPDLAISMLVQALSSLGATVTELKATSLTATRGSQVAIRTLGGFLIPTSQFPLIARIHCTSGEDGDVAEITVEDNMGFGSRLGINGKYQQACDEFATDIVQVLSTLSNILQMRGPADFPAGNVPCRYCGEGIAASAVKCRFCGEFLHAESLLSPSGYQTVLYDPASQGEAVLETLTRHPERKDEFATEIVLFLSTLSNLLQLIGPVDLRVGNVPCRYCGEGIAASAVKCRFCGEIVHAESFISRSRHQTVAFDPALQGEAMIQALTRHPELKTATDITSLQRLARIADEITIELHEEAEISALLERRQVAVDEVELREQVGEVQAEGQEPASENVSSPELPGEQTTKVTVEESPLLQMSTPRKSKNKKKKLLIPVVILIAAIAILAGLAFWRTENVDALCTQLAPNADLTSCDFSGMDLNGADLASADLNGVGLMGTVLYDANLAGANLANANLANANLNGANLENANLNGANLENANLNGANLENVRLENANLNGADLDPAELDRLAIP